MKKILFMFVAVLASQISVAQSTTFTSLVTKAEYQSMDELEKRLTDYLDAAVCSLKGLKLNGSKNYANYEATVSISSNPKDKLSNAIAIGVSDGTPPVNGIQSCTICSVSGAFTCIRRIRTTLQNGQPLIITAVEVSGDCIQVTWD